MTALHTTRYAFLVLLFLACACLVFFARRKA